MGLGIRQIHENLLAGANISLSLHHGERKVRIPWLNLYNHPSILGAITTVIREEVRRRGYAPDSVASIETSGAKYGVATSLALKLPYVSLHKTDKIIFTEPVSVRSISQTDRRTTSMRLYVDRSVMANFKRILLVDDIRRTSRTLDASVKLIRKCGSDLEACFVVFDFEFAGHPLPKEFSLDRYHPLFIIADISEDGRCTIGGESLALAYL